MWPKFQLSNIYGSVTDFIFFFVAFLQVAHFKKGQMPPCRQPCMCVVLLYVHEFTKARIDYGKQFQHKITYHIFKTSSFFLFYGGNHSFSHPCLFSSSHPYFYSLKSHQLRQNQWHNPQLFRSCDYTITRHFPWVHVSSFCYQFFSITFSPSLTFFRFSIAHRYRY